MYFGPLTDDFGYNETPLAYNKVNRGPEGFVVS